METNSEFYIGQRVEVLDNGFYFPAKVVRKFRTAQIEVVIDPAYLPKNANPDRVVIHSQVRTSKYF